jgi:hypothetical protein
MATVVQIPPPVGSSGQFIDVVNISSSTLREIVVIGSPVTSGALAPVTSTGGLRVSLSTEDGNIIRIAGGTTQIAPVSLIDGLLVEVSNPDFFALTSGVVTLSSVHTFVLSSVSIFPGDILVTLQSTGGIIGPLTSSGGLLVTVAGGSIVGSTAINLVGSSNGIAPVTTSGGLGVTILAGAGAGSTAINLVGSSNGIAPVTTSGGLGVTILAGAGAGSTAVNLVGSSNAIAPVTTSGGLGVTILAGAGAGSTAVNIIGTSSAVGPVTSSGGQLVALSNPASLALTSGTVTLSSAIAISSGTIVIASGTVTLSSAIAISSGTVGITSGTVTLSSAIGISSGIVQAQMQTSDATLVFGYVSSSSGNSNLITGSPAAYHGYEVFNTTGQFRFVHFYQTSSAPGVGTTANWMHSVMVPYSTAGGGGAISVKDHAKAYSTKGLGFTITDGPSSTSTGSVGANDVLLTVYYKT